MLTIALTSGEPAGIGCDIALAAWMSRRERGLPPFYLVADPDHVAARAQRIGLSVPLEPVMPEQAFGRFDAALPVVPLAERATALPGHPDGSSAAVSNSFTTWLNE